MYKDRLDDLNIEKRARLEILWQNRKGLQTQVARIKQTIEKILDKDTPLPERIRILIREQIVLKVSTLTTILTGIATIVLSAIGDFGRGEGGRSFTRAVGFVAEHTWALIVLAAGLIGVSLMQRVLRKQAGKK